MSRRPTSKLSYHNSSDTLPDMKLLIISDSHGHIANLKHVMGFAKKLGVDAIIHAGDWNTIEAIDTVFSFGIPVYTVLGNADVREDVIQKLKLKSQKFSEDFLRFQIDGRKIGVVHRFSKNLVSSIEYLDVLFTGHYHSKDDRIVNGVRIVRPGAIINGNNFVIYDTVSGKIEFIEDDKI